MKNKRIISFILSIALVISLIPMGVIKSYAYTNVSNTLPFTFVKTGRVITLVNDFGDYYIMRETFAADGSYVENVVLQTITKTQYDAELSKKEYDVSKVSEISGSIGNTMINSGGGRLYFVNMISGQGGTSTASFVGSLSNGYSNSAKLSEITSEFGSPHSFLLNNNGRYFRGTTNNVTGVTTLVPIEQDAYSLLQLTMGIENISYCREIKYWNDEAGKAHYSDKILGQSGTELVSFVQDAVEIDASIQEILESNGINDSSAAADSEAVDGYDETRYGDAYSEWSDDFNNGYMGSWNDPSFSGKLELVEWEDPFWTNSDINIGDTVAKGGYTDDMGNFIPTDVNGNPIPSVDGSFDSAGNFMPKGLNGYYDPDGVYHPLFEIKNDISIRGDNIYVDDSGYFDKHGLWHEANKPSNAIYLYDGSMISAEGFYYDKNNNLVDIVTSDMWGNYQFGSWLIYSDGTIFDKSTKQLIKNNGSFYNYSLTDKGNYLYDDGTVIFANTLVKGTRKGDSTVVMPNGSTIYETNIIEYGNGIVFNANTIILPSGETLKYSFKDGVIDLGSYGKIYENGHYAEYNEYDDLITDDDRIIINDSQVILPNGYIWNSLGYIKPAYVDGNLFLVTVDGVVYNRQLKQGAYDESGNFVNGAYPDANYYDRLGNQIGVNGTVTSGGVIGYYDENGNFEKGSSIYDGGYYTCDGHWFSLDGVLTKAKNQFGYKNEDQQFIMYNGSGKYTSDGTFYGDFDDNGFYINSHGNLIVTKKSDFGINMDGSVSLLGENSVYYGYGLFMVKNNVGYYDEFGRFIMSRENPYMDELNGFYDNNQKFHYKSEVYFDNNGNLKLLYNPSLGLTVKDGKIGFTYSDQTFTSTGLTTVDGKTGYYDSVGKFIESTNNPYLGGFYSSTGTWIDFTYYTDIYGDTCVNNGTYIYTGNYITPSGDIGYFDESGEFILNKINPYENGFYDSAGVFHSESYIYKDSLGLYKGFGDNFIFTPDGIQITQSKKTIDLAGYKLVFSGIFQDSEGNLGTFDSNGKFTIDKNSYANGIYLPTGGFIDFNDEDSSIGNMDFRGRDFMLIDNDNGEYLIYSYDGYIIELNKIIGGYETLDGANFTDDLKYAIYSNGELKEFNSSVVSNGFWINDKYYVEPGNGDGYFTRNGTFIKYSGGYGHYLANKNFVENYSNPYINGFYDSSSNWVGNNETPNTGYFNNYGIQRNGSNPYNNGYYDSEGTWHQQGQNVIIDINGNARVTSADSVGYRDTDGNTHLYGVDGYFSDDGTYYIGTTMQGYFTNTGDMNHGKNQSLEGFYDMYGNWYQFGNDGYYDSKGKYYSSINGEQVGYYNNMGEFTEGYNPYLNGFYGFNGDWSNKYQEPISVYFDSQKTRHVGTNIYHNGFYDMNGSWYFTGEKGFYDTHGTYYNILTGEVGYYDNLGIYYEGTNPYQHGYYDPNKNLHLFGQEGYYDTAGTYIDVYGNSYYYLSNGIRREGKNPHTDGFYDVRGNWHVANGDGYYDKDEKFHEYLLVVSAFRVGSPDYILFEGIFTNTEYVSSLSKNTVQFSVSSDGMNTRYLDTGIKVSMNAMISYDKATDILHAISIFYDGVFIEDNNSCMLVHDGTIINLKNTGKVSIKQLKDKFIDSDIEIVVAKSRIGERYALADAIEAGKQIDVYNDGTKVKMSYPFIVQNGISYVALNDIKGLMNYNVKISETDEGTILVFTIKDNILGKTSTTMESLTTLVGSYSFTITQGGVPTTLSTTKPFISVKLGNYSNSIIYMPTSLISLLTWKNTVLDTINFDLLLTTKENETPVQDN